MIRPIRRSNGSGACLRELFAFIPMTVALRYKMLVIKQKNNKPAGFRAKLYLYIEGRRRQKILLRSLTGAISMKDILDFLASLPAVPPDRLVGVITLAAIGCAVFALYVVLAVVKERGR
jgi:hypothetical protein